MAITVKFFASLREELEKSEVKLEPEPAMTVAHVWDKACDSAPLPSHVLMAVNMRYVESTTPVEDGDEVAFFPPVTGG
jgi:molybdopterin synthase sulfur carrier subunit